MGKSVGRIALGIGTYGGSEVWRAAGIGAVKGMDSATGAKAARETAKAAGEAQLAGMNRLGEEAAARSAKEESKATQAEAQRAARSRQGLLSSNNRGRRSTILTGPLGLPGSMGGSAPKTVLGA